MCHWSIQSITQKKTLTKPSSMEILLVIWREEAASKCIIYLNSIFLYNTYTIVHSFTFDTTMSMFVSPERLNGEGRRYDTQDMLAYA